MYFSFQIFLKNILKIIKKKKKKKKKTGWIFWPLPYLVVFVLILWLDYLRDIQKCLKKIHWEFM